MRGIMGGLRNPRRWVSGIRRAAALLAVAAVVGCDDGGDGSGGDPFGQRSVGLTAFEDCDGLLDYFRAEGLAALERYAEGGPSPALGRDDFSGAPTAGGENGDGPGAHRPTPRHSETNVQEAGVDEPDTVKTDGRYLYVVRDRRLLIYDAADLSLASETPLAGHGGKLLVDGDQAIVISRGWGAPDEAFPDVDAERLERYPKTVVEVFDLTDRAAPARVRRTYVEGQLLAARMIDRTVRVAVHHDPAFAVAVPVSGGVSGGSGGAEPRPAPTTPPQDGGGADDAPAPVPDASAEREDDAAESLDDPAAREGEAAQPAPDEPAQDPLAPWREAIAQSTIDDWIPWSYEVAGGERRTARVTTCDRFHRPGERAGYGVTAIVSVDLDRPLDDPADPAVVTGPGVVYASRESLYLTTANQVAFAVAVGGGVAQPAGRDAVGTDGRVAARRDGLEVDDDRQATQIHRLDIADPDAPARYVASGRVYGFPLNQFSLGEHEGSLRIATTEMRVRDDQATTENHVFVLREGTDADGQPALNVVGHIDGIAPGERIYAVRFQGDRGFVVTFRQVDPLFTLELSDPTAPRVVGELKVPGFSTYLHPFGPDHLIGIGQAATDEGIVTGLQLSLFDVSDFAHPRAVHQHRMGEGWSQALYDHHAFTFWEPASLLLVPVSAWEQDRPRQGIDVFRVDRDAGFEPRGHISHADLTDEGHRVEPERTLVIGDAAYTVSNVGIKANDLDDLEERARAVFPPAPGGDDGRPVPGGGPEPAPAPGAGAEPTPDDS